MSNSYKIIVRNQTGEKQNYSFFSASPRVSGGPSGGVWSNVIQTAQNTSNGGAAIFRVSSTDYHAICGTFDGSPQQGGSISIGKTVPVSLGSQNAENISMGSTVNLIVDDQSSCDLGPATTPGCGKIGCFQVDTTVKSRYGFTMQDYINNNLLVGIATSKDSSIGAVMGTFLPYPDVTYQIMPQAVFHIAAGERFAVGQLVDARMMRNTVAVDFDARGTNTVTLIHDPDREFTFA